MTPARGGTDGNSAIPGFNPGQSADTLYVTNGETTDYADVNAGTVAFTPELGEGKPGSGFVFPDNERLIQAEFERTLDFDLGLARSAAHPADPESPVGIDVEPFYLDPDDIDPQNGQTSLFDFKFDKSYGDPQEVRVLAARNLGDVTLRYRINGGAVSERGRRPNGRVVSATGSATAPTTTSSAGEVTGTDPGDSVKVWFEGGGARSDSFTYDAVSDSGKRVLVLSAEDYTGASPDQPPGGPFYLSYYADALAANGVDFDVYDVDANGRTAPDNLGVLSHYDAVVWYTGDDVVTREPGWGPGNASRLAMQELLEVRDYVNEGGRVLYTGQRGRAAVHHRLSAPQLYDPFNNAQCSAEPGRVWQAAWPCRGPATRRATRSSTSSARRSRRRDGGSDPDTGDPFDVSGIDEPLDGLTWGFNGADSAQNQASNSSFIATGDFLEVTDPAHSFPQFESWPAAEYLSGLSGPFDPHTGQSFMWSDRADEAYKRLTRTITVPAGGATMSFWTSYNLELDFDYMIVEAHTVGQDNWTTLPDLNGHTTSDSEQRSGLHGWLEQSRRRGQRAAPVPDPLPDVRSGDGRVQPDGDRRGEWNAANGSSSGWQQFEVNISGRTWASRSRSRSPR